MIVSIGFNPSNVGKQRGQVSYLGLWHGGTDRHPHQRLIEHKDHVPRRARSFRSGHSKSVVDASIKPMSPDPFPSPRKQPGPPRENHFGADERKPVFCLVEHAQCFFTQRYNATNRGHPVTCSLHRSRLGTRRSRASRIGVTKQSLGTRSQLEGHDLFVAGGLLCHCKADTVSDSLISPFFYYP